MPLPPIPPDTPQETPSEDPERLVVLVRGRREDLDDLALVLAARRVPHALRRRSGVLLVPWKERDRALSEWRRYAEENASWPEPPPAPGPVYRVTPLTWCLMLALALFHIHTGHWTDGNPWFLAGAADSLAIRRGEGFRLVTALTLHADSSHLLGNALVGGIVLQLLCRQTGQGAAWLLTLLAAALGNACNCLLRPGPHLSVGFSTAVFAAIGLLCGMQRFRSRRALFRLLAPLGAGVGLVAMLGAEGARTDLGAHLFGLACGLGLGFAWRPLRRPGRARESLARPLTQRLALVLALVLVWASWRAALG